MADKTPKFVTIEGRTEYRTFDDARQALVNVAEAETAFLAADEKDPGGAHKEHQQWDGEVDCTDFRAMLRAFDRQVQAAEAEIKRLREQCDIYKRRLVNRWRAELSVEHQPDSNRYFMAITVTDPVTRQVTSREVAFSGDEINTFLDKLPGVFRDRLAVVMFEAVSAGVNTKSLQALRRAVGL